MPAESRRATALDGRHDLQLVEAHVAGIGATPGGPVVAEDVRDLQSWTGHVSRALGGRLSLLELARDAIERAHDLADRLGGDACIECGGIEFGVAEQDLDYTNVDLLLEQMRGKAVPERVRRYALVDPCHVSGGMARAIELAGRQRLHWIAAGEQPAARVRDIPPNPQQLEEMRGEHDVPVFATLALLDADHHALAVDVGYLERDHLGGAQPRPIGDAQCGFVLRPRRSIEQPRHFLWAENDR